MRVLLDECVNPRVRTVQEMGWCGITNGKFLELAQNLFDVFVTLYKNLEYQQNLRSLTFGIIVVSVPDNKIGSYRSIFSQLLRAAEMVLPGDVIRITGV